MLKLILILGFLASPVMSFAQSSGASAAANNDQAIPKGCEDFTADQLNKDPNAPCFEAVRPTLDPKQAEGNYYEPYMTSSHKDECEGCHVLSNLSPSDDTNKNIYELPFLKSAVPQFGGGGNDAGSDHGDAKSGTD